MSGEGGICPGRGAYVRGGGYMSGEGDICPGEGGICPGRGVYVREGGYMSGEGGICPGREVYVRGGGYMSGEGDICPRTMCSVQPAIQKLEKMFEGLRKPSTKHLTLDVVFLFSSTAKLSYTQTTKQTNKQLIIIKSFN